MSHRCPAFHLPVPVKITRAYIEGPDEITYCGPEIVTVTCDYSRRPEHYPRTPHTGRGWTWESDEHGNLHGLHKREQK